MGKRTVRYCLCLMVLILTVSAIPGYNRIVERVTGIMGEDVLVIDAGHGGMDGGAQSSTGVLEKGINLAIAKELKTQAEAYGWRVVLTRETDEALSEKGTGTIRNFKTQDMKLRGEMIEKIKPDITVSIHLNSFTADPSVKGAQVFYPDMGGTEEMLKDSKKLAREIQAQMILSLKSEKQRSILPKHDVYLMKQIFSPMVLIECGFLSNAEEAENLQKSAYQQKIAEGILAGITKFTGKTPPEPIPSVDSRKETKEKK